MTAEQLMFSVMQWRAGRGFVLPNFYAPGWWECDVYEVTESGYFYEYEIKVSVSDFRADRNKSRYVRGEAYRKYLDDWQAARLANTPLPESPKETKHELLARGDSAGPSKFFFVVPADIEEKVAENLPTWAGLLVVDRAVGPFQASALIREPVGAPRLHMEKVGEARHQAYVNAYRRYIDLFWGSVHRRNGALERAAETFK